MIQNGTHQWIPSWWRKTCVWILAFSWIVGMLFGILAASAASDILIPMMRGAVQSSVSIPGLLAATVLPFLFSAYAVSFSQPWAIPIISAVKAFSFGYCGYGVSLAFGQGSWLVRFLLLFSDCCLIPVLFHYWVRNISGEGDRRWQELPIYLCIALFVGCVDYCLIAPFLVSLI